MRPGNPYSLSSLLNLVKNPRRITEAAAVLREDIAELPLDMNRYWYTWRRTSGGVDMIQKDWDTLILLDACRYDWFNELSPFDDISKVRSPATESLSFMRSTFEGRKLHDTVYVTANPYIEYIEGDVFHHVEKVYHTHWDEDVGTVRPETMAKQTIEMHSKFPNKRIIAHFMQPHFPFLGETGSEFDDSIIDPDQIGDSSVPHPWYDQMDGKGVPRDQLLKAYRENYELVLPKIEEVIENVSGKIAISSDHANLIGERGFVPVRLYGHPRKLPHPNLITVPWVEIEGGRRKITEERPITSNENLDVETQLTALGYQ